MLNFLSGNEWLNYEGELSKLGLFLLFHGHAHSFKHCWLVHHVAFVLLLDLAGSFLLLIDLGEEVSFCISVELPDIDAVLASSRYDLVVVARVEHYICDWVCVTYEGLEVVRNCLLCFIIPQFYKIVVATRQHESSVQREVNRVY